MNIKPYKIALAIAVVLNFVLFVFQVVSITVFWVVVIIAAVLAYKVLPRMEEDL